MKNTNDMLSMLCRYWKSTTTRPDRCKGSGNKATQQIKILFQTGKQTNQSVNQSTNQSFNQ